MRNVAVLRTRKDRLREDQAEALRQALLPFLDDPTFKDARDPLARILVEISRQTTPEPGTTEPFAMIRPSQHRAVVDWLEANSKRPMKAMRIWALLFEHLLPHTGQIMLTREEIAEKVRISADDVSTIMNELVAFRALFTQRERVPGLRGPGLVRYFMNKHVAEVGSRATQDALVVIPKPGTGRTKLQVVRG